MKPNVIGIIQQPRTGPQQLSSATSYIVIYDRSPYYEIKYNTI